MRVCTTDEEHDLLFHENNIVQVNLYTQSQMSIEVRSRDSTHERFDTFQEFLARMAFDQFPHSGSWVFSDTTSHHSSCDISYSRFSTIKLSALRFQCPQVRQCLHVVWKSTNRVTPIPATFTRVVPPIGRSYCSLEPSHT